MPRRGQPRCRRRRRRHHRSRREGFLRRWRLGRGGHRRRSSRGPQRTRIRRDTSMGQRLSPVQKPVIAKVRGYCIGLGNELNLLCDLTIAGTSARFGQAGPKVGSVPMVGGTQLLPSCAGSSGPKRSSFCAGPIRGRPPCRWGWPTRSCLTTSWTPRWPRGPPSCWPRARRACASARCPCRIYSTCSGRRCSTAPSSPAGWSTPRR